MASLMDQSVIDVEKENIKTLTLYRSLYVLKRKFEIYKDKIYNVYAEAKGDIRSKLLVIPVNEIASVLNNVMNLSDFLLITYSKYNEVLTAELLSEISKEKAMMITELIERYGKENVGKYNMIFYEKKMNEIKRKKQIEESKRAKNEEIVKQIALYDKRGKIIMSHDDVIINNVPLNLLSPAYEINEEDIAVLYSTQFIYCETLPLIIADFIQMNENIAIIDTNDELSSELRSLFDGEIMRKCGDITKVDPIEENKNKLKDLLYEELNVDKSIDMYQNLIVEKLKKAENIQYLQKVVKKLQKQKKFIREAISRIQNGNSNNIQNDTTNFYENTNMNVNNISKNSINSIRFVNDKGLNISKIPTHPKREDNRKNALREIFFFYCRQHNLVGSSPTFDTVKEKKENLDLAEFTKFCAEFQIRVNKSKLTEVFKKTASNSRLMNFDEFCISLQKLAIEINEEKKNFLCEKIKESEKEVKEIEKSIKLLNEKQKKEEEENMLNEQQRQEEEIVINKIEENPIKPIKEEPEIEEEKHQEESKKIPPNIENLQTTGENPEKETEIFMTRPDNASYETKEEDMSSMMKFDRVQSLSKLDESRPDSKAEDKMSSIPPLQSQLLENRPKSKNVKLSLQYQSQLLKYNERKATLLNLLSNLNSDYDKLNNKPLSQLQNELYQLLDIEHSSAYKSKMKGFAQPKSKIKLLTKPKQLNIDIYSSAEIRELLIQRKNAREKAKQQKEAEEKKIIFEQKKQRLLTMTKKSQINASKKLQNKQYKAIVQEQKDYDKEKYSKITWNELQNYDYNHFILEGAASQSDVRVNQMIFNDTSDSEEEELLNHLITKEKKEINIKQSIEDISRKKPNKNLQSSFDQIPSNQRRTFIPSSSAVTTSARKSINRNKIINGLNNSLTTQKEILRESKEKTENLYKKFEKGSKTVSEINTIKTANAIRKLEKIRVYKKL